MVNEWDKLDEETLEQYQIFLKYLTLPRRSTKFLINKDYPDGTIKTWQARYNWTNRAKAFDAEIAKSLQIQQKDLLLSNQRTIISDTLNDYNLTITMWRKLMDENPDISPKDYVSLLNARKVIDDLGRRAVELPNIYKQLDVKMPGLPEPKDLQWSNPISELPEGNNNDYDSEV